VLEAAIGPVAAWVIPILLAYIPAVVIGFRRWQNRHVFRRLGIHPARNVWGFMGYVLVYQVLTSSASLRGYAQYVIGAGRRWK
jgi:biofilm PGA synthesis N-glycosyltransferase PgaC